MQTRIMMGIISVFMTGACLAGEPAEKPDATPEAIAPLHSANKPPEYQVEFYLAGKYPLEIRTEMLTNMLRLGDAVVDPIVANWSPMHMSRLQVRELAALLGQINSEKALFGLKRILMLSSFVPEDIVGDPMELLKKLGDPNNKELTPAQVRIRAIMPDDANASFAAMFKDKKADLAEMAQMLNRILAINFTYPEGTLDGITMSDEFKTYVTRHAKENKKRDSISLLPPEIMRMNRLLIENAFPGMFRPGVASLDPTVYRAMGVKDALQALSKMTLPEAESILLSYQPDPAEEMTHMRILAIMENPRATNSLLEKVFSSDPGVSGNAIRVLQPRFSKDSTSVYRAFRTLSRRFEGELANLTPDKEHITRNYMSLCMEYPTKERGDALADALVSKCALLRKSALEALQMQADLIANNNIYQALEQELGRNDVATSILILQAVQRSGLEEGIGLAGIALHSENNAIAIRATRTLRSLTGKQIGDNPEAWNAWLTREE